MITQEDLIANIRAEKSTSLDLSRNNLGGKTRAELAEVFAAIPATVTTLDLSWNFLGFHESTFVPAFSAIPATITTINLTGNNLGTMRKNKLVEVLNMIHTTVKKLYLRHNLGYLTWDEFAQALTAIPDTVTYRYLEGNPLIKNSFIKFGYYLNFCSEEFVTHSNLDKSKIIKHMSGFGSTWLNRHMPIDIRGRIGMFLTSYDLARTYRVCKEKTSREESNTASHGELRPDLIHAIG